MLLKKDCWPSWPEWECYAANVTGLVSAGVWFVVLLPQVAKNWCRRSVEGLSFLWAVSNFTASLVNLFFAFSVSLPLYARISAVYMPVLEFTILCQFMAYSPRSFSARLLVLLACLLAWGGLVELELNLPQSRDKLQWVAIVLWSIESFPQIILNMKRQSTSGQALASVLITLLGKTTDFLATYGLQMPLPYVVMCYFSSTTAFVNGLQVFLYGGRKTWYMENCRKEAKIINGKEKKSDFDKLEKKSLLTDAPIVKGNRPSPPPTTQQQLCCHGFSGILWGVSMCYICLGLCVFAVGIFWRTGSYFSLLGPLTCCAVVLAANEYYVFSRTRNGGLSVRMRVFLCSAVLPLQRCVERVFVYFGRTNDYIQ